MTDDTPPPRSTGLAAGLKWNRARDMPHVTPANRNVPYDHRLNGHPTTLRSSSRWPTVVLDPDVAVELRRAMMGVVP